ncbi:MAG TPA: hypothetical protein DIT19_04775 [Desulfonauticus sp.]|jgi:4-amino-4-deoxy-L-arabinose transferase-like glycosyltransferase|nr:MAG: Uncharacterized protein XD41_0835 [Desulfonauticus sp. 38_4375]MDK2922049.1 hypothetical protein [Desulfonauticus sp.]HCO12521.1 hypothetical protein [Desulfonauticus sp.]
MLSKGRLYNFLRHFIICFGGLFYGFSPLFFLYQCFGLFFELPGVFLHKITTPTGQWWIEINFKHQVFISFWIFLFLISFIYALFNLNNFRPYADSKIKSLPGF